MRNITVSVDDVTYRKARIHAAELDTSVSALVRDYLGSRSGEFLKEHTAANRKASHEEYVQRLDDLFTDWDARGIGLRGYDRLTREEVHDRERARLEMRLDVAEQEREFLALELGELEARAAEASVPYQVHKANENAGA